MTTILSRAASRPALHMASAALVMALCGTALGQNALGNGHALDANLSANQGRVNTRVNTLQEQIRFNNSVITGSAANGKSFQGFVGYRAPDQFGAIAGSDALYNFQRDSYSSALAAAGVRGSDALRYQFALQTGQYVPASLSAAALTVPRDSNVSTNAYGSASSGLRSTSDYLTSQGFRPSIVGTRQDTFGAEYVAKASPLLGVTWVKTAESPLGGPQTLATTPGETPTNNVPLPGGTLPSAVQPGATPFPSAVQPGATPPVNPLEPAKTAPGEKPAKPGSLGPDALLNTANPARDNPQFDNRVKGLSLEQKTVAYTQLMNKFREGFDETKPNGGEPNAPKGAPEPVTIDMQMERLRRMMRGEPEPKPGDKTPTKNPDGTSIQPKPGDTPGNQPKPAPATPPAVDTSKPVGLGPAPATKPAPTPSTAKEMLSPNVVSGLRKVGEKKIEHLYDKPAKPDAAHGDPDGYKVAMGEGEDLLAKGRFFDAEERFVRSMASMPGDPMARVGRIHSEIGAGLYLSAAANLRMLFTEHPEMIASRYEGNLLPSPDRTKVIVDQLVEQEKKAESSLGRESALLVAYMGYQQGNTQLVKSGLDDFASRLLPGELGDADRSMLEVVRAAWATK